MNVHKFGKVVFEKVKQRFVDMLSSHGNLDGRLCGVHLLQNDAEVDGVIASVTFAVDFPIEML